MIKQILGLGGISIGISLMVCSATQAAAQQAQPAASNAGYKQPKTPWGEPDLQGIWPLNHLISTPFQRQQKYGDRRFMTDEEFAAAQKSADAWNKRFESGAIPQADSGTQVMRLTSLLSDPPNGRFPALTAKGKDLYDKMHGSYKPGQTVFDSPEDFDSWDRCITRGMPVSMLPRNYNNGIRIMQSPGYVLIVLEMAHEVRIIPTDGRPVLDKSIKEWLGESRGHWEGNTLVVETTNFNGKTDMTNAGVPGSPPINPTTENMGITERFTRTDNDTIEYQMTVNDPELLTRPWSAAFPLKLDGLPFLDFRMEAPANSMRCALWTRRSRMLSATVGSAKPHAASWRGSIVCCRFNLQPIIILACSDCSLRDWFLLEISQNTEGQLSNL